MCNGHPHHHPCGHQSVKWHYCPRAKIDVKTGNATACSKTTYAVSQPAKTRCPLKNCYFKELGGVWDCCVCHQGPNTQGWCAFPSQSWQQNFHRDEYELVKTCDHGCCKNCVRSRMSSCAVCLLAVYFCYQHRLRCLVSRCLFSALSER